MIIELPKRINLTNAKIQGNYLILYEKNDFENTMYELTYVLRKIALEEKNMQKLQNFMENIRNCQDL